LKGIWRGENQIETSNWKIGGEKFEMGQNRSAMDWQIFKSFEQTERFALRDLMEMKPIILLSSCNPESFVGNSSRQIGHGLAHPGMLLVDA
jgi:hypothetical protein